MIPLVAILVSLAALSQLSNGREVDERIFDGKNASKGMFPFQVYLEFTNSANQSTMCGGSLISSKFILTAGHCTHEIENITVRIGQVYIDRSSQNGIIYYLNTSSVHFHPEYNYSTQVNDVSIIELPEDVKLNAFVNVINLPKRSWTDPSTFDNGMAFAQGWGQTYTDDVNLPHKRLQFAFLHIMPHRLCELYLGNSTFQIYNGTICADKLEPSGVCKGDSGGGLSVNVQGNRFLIGLASWVVGGCINYNPGVFSYIPAVLDWINQVTNIPIED